MKDGEIADKQPPSSFRIQRKKPECMDQKQPAARQPSGPISPNYCYMSIDGKIVINMSKPGTATMVTKGHAEH